MNHGVRKHKGGSQKTQTSKNNIILSYFGVGVGRGGGVGGDGVISNMLDLNEIEWGGVGGDGVISNMLNLNGGEGGWGGWGWGIF